jgi:hypothetical protein
MVSAGTQIFAIFMTIHKMAPVRSSTFREEVHIGLKTILVVTVQMPCLVLGQFKVQIMF